MYCKKCGTVIPAGNLKCDNCGWEVPSQNPNQSESLRDSSVALQAPVLKKTAKIKLSVWLKLAIASLCCGFFTFCEGLNKMFRYDSGDLYPHNYVNAYVGGDAYNYIINGNYATAFFVLTTMFVLTAVGLVIIHYTSQKEEK